MWFKKVPTLRVQWPVAYGPLSHVFSGNFTTIIAEGNEVFVICNEKWNICLFIIKNRNNTLYFCNKEMKCSENTTNDHKSLVAIYSPEKNAPAQRQGRALLWGLISIRFKPTTLRGNANGLPLLPMSADEDFNDLQARENADSLQEAVEGYHWRPQS